MLRRGWDAVILRGCDPHCSEYLAPRWQQVTWLSGFTGEAADMVVTRTHAGLWTDSRYFIQANVQLSGSGVELHKTRVPEEVSIPDWIAASFAGRENGIVIAVDGKCQTLDSIRDLERAMGKAGFAEDDFRIVDIPDLPSLLWEDRPEVPAEPIITLGEDICGESRSERLEWLRGEIAAKGCDAALLTSLDEIAYILNIRGGDIECTPMAISFLLVGMDYAMWFVKKDGVTPDHETAETFEELQNDGVRVEGYDDIGLEAGGIDTCFDKLFVDPSTLNYNLFSCLPSEKLIFGVSPVQLKKSIKNETEIANMREIHIEDGLALEKFFFWLENNIKEGIQITEIEAADMLDTLRGTIEGYCGNSFPTISAYGPGAALPHYVTPRENCPVIENHGLYLCDSGGQYIFGTTDITRTIPVGPCTEEEIMDYTLVLKGHIDLAMAAFPAGTPGCRLDALARNPLWRHRRDFGHGTGHGIGFFLSCHEGPQSIRQNLSSQAILPGMFTSNEPGIYIEGKYGIRHENILLCQEEFANEFGKWFSFETVSLCHFDTSVLDKKLLSQDEIAWLNEYNERVYQTLSPRLPEAVATWLRDKTLPV